MMNFPKQQLTGQTSGGAEMLAEEYLTREAAEDTTTCSLKGVRRWCVCYNCVGHPCAWSRVR